VIWEVELPEEMSWGRIDGALMRAPLPYPVISLFIGIIIYLIYAFFYFNVGPLEPYWEKRSLTLLVLSAAIAYQITGIRFLLKKMKTIFLEFNSFYGIEAINDSEREDEPSTINKSLTLYDITKNRFKKSRWFYVLLPLVIVPFYLIDSIRGIDINEILFRSYSAYYNSFIDRGLEDFQIAELIGPEKNIFMAYDIYSNLVGILFLILLSIIVWIIFNTAWGLSDAGKIFSNTDTDISIFSLNNLLLSIRSDVLIIVAYYFICIALAIFSYPFTGYLTFEVAFLLTLLLLGVILFLVGIEAIQSILKGQAKQELNKINERSRDSSKRLISIASEEDYSDKTAKISSISSMLDILQKERERIMLEKKGYDISTMITFGITFLIPFLSFMEKYWPKIAPILQDNSTLLNLSQIIPK
jgi:hypothetical protein